MNQATHPTPYRGVFPVAPTIFDDNGQLDLEGQKRCLDFMIDAGSNGLCILANQNQYALAFANDPDKDAGIRGLASNFLTVRQSLLK